MLQAINAHDIGVLVGCFADDYRCEIPLHPSRSFVGKELSRLSPDTYRSQSYESWEGVAAGWEHWREYIDKSTAAVRTWLLRELAAKPGDTVLDLAAGAGDTGFEVAAIIWEQGRLISTDFSPEMIEVARRRAQC
jgi:cyclopropane fatty-acyl-phospholipid synthase-like methyltransferase